MSGQSYGSYVWWLRTGMAGEYLEELVMARLGLKHTHTHIFTCTHTFTHTHFHLHSHIHTHSHTHMHAQFSLALTHTHTITLTCSHIHTHTHTHTRTHTRTLTHSLSQRCPQEHNGALSRDEPDSGQHAPRQGSAAAAGQALGDHAGEATGAAETQQRKVRAGQRSF